MKFIVMIYQEEQNEPSMPERKLLEVKDVKELRKVAPDIFMKLLREADDTEDVGKLSFGKAGKFYGDFVVSSENGEHVFFTRIEEV